MPRTTDTLSVRAWSLRILLPCDERVTWAQPFDVTIAVTELTSDLAKYTASTPLTGIRCSVAFAAPPAPVSAFEVVIRRTDSTTLPAGTVYVVAVPLSATTVIVPTSPQAQDVKIPANATVLFICPPPMIQASQRMQIITRPAGSVTSAMRIMIGASAYGLDTKMTSEPVSWYAGVSPGNLASFTLNLGHFSGGSSTLLRVLQFPSTGISSTGELVLVGSSLSCKVPACALGNPITALYTAVLGTYTLSTLSVTMLYDNRGSPCRYVLTCPVGLTAGVLVNIGYGDPRVPLINEQPLFLTESIPSSAPKWLTNPTVDGAYTISVDAFRAVGSNFSAYPIQWGVPGPLLVSQGNYYNVQDYSALTAGINGTVTCAAQARCPTPNASAVRIVVNTTRTILTYPGIPWSGSERCEWTVQCTDRYGQSLSAQYNITYRAVGVVFTWMLSSSGIPYMKTDTPTSQLVQLAVTVSCARPSNPASPPPPQRVRSMSRSVTRSASETDEVTVAVPVPDPGPPEPTGPTGVPPSPTPTTARVITTRAVSTTAAPPPPSTTSTASTRPTSVLPSTTSTGPAVSTSTSAVPSATTMPPPSPPSPPASTSAPPTNHRRTRTATLSFTLTTSRGGGQRQPPTIALIAAAAADSPSLDPKTIAISIGVIAGVVLLLAGLGFFGRRFVNAWRRRRRGGDDDAAVQPMQDRTAGYRWYEDAQDVAADLEQRGDAVQRLDHEGLLCMPTILETVTPVQPSAAGGRVAPPSRATMRVNPLLIAQGL
jgi:hypothetical protein